MTNERASLILRKLRKRLSRQREEYLRDKAKAILTAKIDRIALLTLLYLGSASLAPSPARARADGGVVRDV